MNGDLQFLEALNKLGSGVSKLILRTEDANGSTQLEDLPDESAIGTWLHNIAMCTKINKRGDDIDRFI